MSQVDGKRMLYRVEFQNKIYKVKMKKNLLIGKMRWGRSVQKGIFRIVLEEFGFVAIVSMIVRLFAFGEAISEVFQVDDSLEW